MKTNTLLKVDSSTEKLPDGELSLEQMYKAIGCTTVELVALPDGTELWCDENGLAVDSPKMNLKATMLYRKHYGPEVLIVGDVILTK